VNNANNVALEVIAITVLRCAGDSQRSDVHREHKLGQVTRPSTCKYDKYGAKVRGSEIFSA